ncbi:MAG: UDP-N-acetylglucosamine 2-epimerase (non-hydrolyzing) [Acidimicrobiales bacterium]|nr:UDP-N-acetylglucosamine 2-epimerase (non-hydrolyzing) [Acidimicrobiales bacterium]
MKVAPILAELDRRGRPGVLVHTGQHYDAAMSDVFFEELGIPEPDHHLEVGSASHAIQTARVMEAFEPVLLAEKPDVVIVAGDVNSTVACALVAAKLGVKVAHVEAGLRSRDWSMPEEVNRLVTDRLSQYLLAPSQDGVDNLLAEGYPKESIHFVGNVMVDTLLNNLERAKQRPILKELGVEPGGYAVLTLHRPSNVDDPETLGQILEAIRHVGTRVPVLWPVHPRLRGRVRHLGLPQSVRLLNPAGYLDFIALQADAALVLTDSGGLQEETTILGTPCLTLRNNTERPVTITDGTNQLAGTDPTKIVFLADKVLSGQTPPALRPPLWDGHAAVRIVSQISST